MSTSTTNYEKLLADAELSDSEHCHLLSAERRRIVCNVLAEEGAPLGLGELAAMVSTREHTTDDQSDVRIALHHVHLPKLDDAGVVDYDIDAGQVSVSQAGFDRLAE